MLTYGGKITVGGADESSALVRLLPQPSRLAADGSLRPSRVYGQGHAADTAAFLDALAGMDLSGKTVLDVGAGTGILAIAAAKLGAARVYAYEADPDAFDLMRRNAALNKVQLVARRAFPEDWDGSRADVAFANLGAVSGELVDALRAAAVSLYVTSEDNRGVHRAS